MTQTSVRNKVLLPFPFHLHFNKVAFAAIIAEESEHQSACVPNSLPHFFFLIERRTFALLLQLLVISLKVKYVSCKELVCAHSCCRKVTILFCSIASGIPFKLSDIFLIIACFHSSMPKISIGLYPANCNISIFKC